MAAPPTSPLRKPQSKNRTSFNRTPKNPVMSSPELLTVLQAAGGVLSADNTTIEHFGNVAAELQAAQTSAVVCPVPQLIRIRAIGKDRAKFLHSFCTNNVSALQPGQVCEAFFTDVKAKVLAHGWILATADAHEIWMLPGDEQALLTHLNRYIITEDVTIESVTEVTALAIIGPQAHTLAQSVNSTLNAATDTGIVTPDFAALATTWHHNPVIFISVPQQTAAATWHSLIAAAAVPAGNAVFQHIRILEGYPLIGTDLNNDNMAPEADRNQTAISYTKGCYLGQEPIARLDAMGHVNRKLYTATAAIDSGIDSNGAVADIPVPTSVSQIAADTIPVLIVLPVKKVVPDQEFPAALPDGTAIRLTVS